MSANFEARGVAECRKLLSLGIFRFSQVFISVMQGYGNRRIQYELCDKRTGSCMPVTKTGHGLGAGCTRGFSVTLTGAFGVTT